MSELPREVLVKVFDSVRILCAAVAVCPSWREAAAEPIVWRVLRVPTDGNLENRANEQPSSVAHL